MVPKNGINCLSAMSPSALSSGPNGSRPKGNQPIKVVCGLDSSGFSGQMSEHNKGIAKKDIPLFLTCIAFREKGVQQKKDIPMLLHCSFSGEQSVVRAY